VLGAALIGYVVLKYLRRRLFLRRLRIARITPEDLRRKLEAGEDIAIVDLRTALDVAPLRMHPGSRWIPAEHLDESLSEIPGIVSWSSTAPDPTKPPAPVWRFDSSVAASRESGADGGMRRWMDLGFPVRELPPVGDPALETSRPCRPTDDVLTRDPREVRWSWRARISAPRRRP